MFMISASGTAVFINYLNNNNLTNEFSQKKFYTKCIIEK